MNSFADIQNVVWPLLSAIGAFFVAAGGIGAIVYWLFKAFSERWLNAKFEERLAAYKHAQQKELEQVRFEISKLMDRTIKLHQREFEVLPEAWSLLNDAYWEVRGLVASLQQYPDINKMGQSQLDEFLEKSLLPKWQQDELRTSSDKTRYYIELIAWKKIYEAKKTYSKLQIYLLKNGIFIPLEIKEKFSGLDDLIRGALVEHEVAKQHGLAISDQKDLMKLIKEGGALMKHLERDVQERLWSSK